MRCRLSNLQALGLCLFTFGAAGVAQAESEIESVDKRFEVATEYFGDGVVQMHSRQDGEAGAVHDVHHINCRDLFFATPYTSVEAPSAFPINVAEENMASFDQTDEIAPLAQHACTKHGYPILEW